MINTHHLLAAIGTGLVLAVPAAAQLSSSASSSGGGAGPMAQDQAETAVVEFAGLRVEVLRVLATGETGHYRVVANITDVSGSEEWRHAAWMLQFPPTLIDDMGNEYVISSVRGAIGTCNDNRDAEYCWNREWRQFTELAARTPAVAVIDFLPSDGHAIPELMAAASTINFAARIAVNPGENDAPGTADVVINGLTLPRR